MDIFTVGYEGEIIENWTDRLVEAGVTVLIDIREKPISRKKGFSKTALKKQLEENNIGYIHCRDLGSPSDIRKQLHHDKDFITFFDLYDHYLDENQDTLVKIIEEVKGEKPCLMCFEKNHRQCHRSAVAKRLEKIYPDEVRIVHL
ncbi:DUF488 domain-containing protein [Gorillibacterium timonense]|uniref:DUF488 domain-containing protein n=1 Tax=Gorillibacterium timonense TaxID=1689269 RepID=UPI00071C460A|nr:DUF488 domain-containing protein [Gorillibacterium timonense]